MSQDFEPWHQTIAIRIDPGGEREARQEQGRGVETRGETKSLEKSKLDVRLAGKGPGCPKCFETHASLSSGDCDLIA